MAVNNNELSFVSKLESIINEVNNMDDEVINTDDIPFTTDGTKMYLMEISKYPLLTEEEEKRYATMLQFPEKNKLLLIDGDDNAVTYLMNIPLLFNSLEHTNAYNDVIDLLLSFSSKIKSGNTIVEDKLLKYRELSNKLKRPLLENELKQYFDIDDSVYLDEKELLVEIRKYILYKYAFDKMFVSNLRLVVSVAKKFFGKIDLLDIITEGNIGLMKAIAKYDVSLGYRFSTYAVCWIKQYINRDLINNNYIRIPECFYREIRAYKRKVEELEKIEKRSLSIEEISEKLNIPIEKIDKYKQYMFDFLSLNQTVGKDDDISLIDLVAIDEDIDKKVFDAVVKDDISSIFRYLNDREILVLKMRFGLNEYSDNALSYQEVSRRLSISAVRVRQIEYKALFKITKISKHDDKIMSLRDYIY